MPAHSDLDDLLKAVAEAFPPHPLDPSRMKRSWAGGYLDGAAFRADLDGRRWDDLNRAFMEFHGETIHFLKPPAFAELLPAYLVTVLRHEERLDMLPTFVISALTPPDDSELRPSYVANLASLTLAQLQVVVHVLDWLRKPAVSQDVRDSASMAWRGLVAEARPER